MSGRRQRNEQNQHPPTQQVLEASPQSNDMSYLDFGIEDPERLVIGGGLSDLDRLGPSHHAIPTATLRAFSQADFAYPPAVESTIQMLPQPQAAHLSLSPTPAYSYPAFQQSLSSRFGPGLDFQEQSGSNSIYTDDNSPTVSGFSNASIVSYASQQASTDTDPRASSYVSSAMMQGADFYPWTSPASDAKIVLGTPESTGGLGSPVIETRDSLGAAADGGFSESDLGTRNVSTAAFNSWKPQPQESPERGEAVEGSPGQTSAASPVHRTGGSRTSKSKLRSASRTSKNLHIRPEETPQERKSRTSHNLVEKQYRNRLNQKFETLMNSLPESVRSPPPGGPDPDGGIAAMAQNQGFAQGFELGLGSTETAEGKLSKAQVLDLSTKYIRQLEDENERLERGQQEQLDKIRRMKAVYESQTGRDGDEFEREADAFHAMRMAGGSKRGGGSGTG